MSDEQFDAIVVGTGQAGPPLAGRLAQQGLRTAVIERKDVGGSCVNHGCIPTKALVASARVAHMARRASDFGLELEGALRVDMPAVKRRMREISGESNQAVTGWLEGLERVELIRGHARFEAAHTLSVGERRLSAPRIFINVGARAHVPELPGLDRVRCMTSSDLLASDELPAHLVVVGGGVIGLELGQIYRRLGSRVSIVERGPRLARREDEDVSRAIAEILESEGIELRLEAECIGVEPHADGVAVQLSCKDDVPALVGTHLLLAVGRVPNTDDLGLEAAGIETDERGYITVDDQLRTGVDGVWALGDCNGRGAFTHTSYNDYEIVAANLFDDDPRRVSDRIECYAIYIDPPLGRAGMSEREARASGRKVLIGTRPMSKVGRAKERSETQGFMKFLVDADSHQLLGAAVLGIRGDEVVHGLLDVMYAGSPYTTIARAVHIHPTVSELVPTTLQGLKPLE